MAVDKILLIFSLCMVLKHANGHMPEKKPKILKRAQTALEETVFPASLSKFDEYQPEDSIASMFIQPLPPPVPSPSVDQQFQWLERPGPSETTSFDSGWYGFNRFVPKSARNLPPGTNRRARSAFHLGESTQLYPVTDRGQRHFDDNLLIQKLQELQRNLRPIPNQKHFLEPQFFTIKPLNLQSGVFVPVAPEFRRRPQRNVNYQRQRGRNYRSSGENMRRLATAPTPVTIKVVPLKINSMDIAKALKVMSWMPIPLDFLKVKNGNKNADSRVEDPTYDDDEEADLPPPSSHVATPMNKPLGITYADSLRSERYSRKYHPRR